MKIRSQYNARGACTMLTRQRKFTASGEAVI